MATSETTASTNTHLEVKPISFNRILVGLDFTEPSQRALQVALTLAEQFESEVTVVHALPILVSGMDSAAIVPEATEAMVKSNEDRIDKAVRSIGAGNTRVKKVIEVDSAVELLARQVKDIQADLLVLGSHATSGPLRIVLGSVAETMLRHIDCPVMIAGPSCQRASHPFRSILFATDLVRTGQRAAQYAVALAEQYQSRLTLMHVLEEKQTMAGRIREEVEQACTKKLESLLPEAAELWCRPKAELAYGEPSEEILSAASACLASLIVVGIGEHGALADHSPWSTIGKILRQSTCPVLAVPNYRIEHQPPVPERHS